MVDGGGKEKKDNEAEREVSDKAMVVFGTAARAVATMLLQPMDVIKVRVQLCVSSGVIFYPKTVRAIIAKEGLSVLYYGFTAGVLRQVMYCSTRLSLYTALYSYEYFNKANSRSEYLGRQLILDSLTSACAAFVSTPAELALIRMTEDACFLKRNRKNYNHAIDALIRIYKEEGTTSLWRGAVPTMTHAIIGRLSFVTCHPPINRYFIDNFGFSPGLLVEITTAMITEFFSTIIVLPSDIVKTNMQSKSVMKANPQLKGPIGTLVHIVKTDKVSALWRGFVPYYLRRGPHTVFSIIMIQYTTDYYLKHFSNTSR